VNDKLKNIEGNKLPYSRIAASVTTAFAVRRRLPLSLMTLPRKVSAIGETVHIFLIHLLTLLEKSGRLLLKFLLNFFFCDLGRFFCTT
jgi:hypothetical protein